MVFPDDVVGRVLGECDAWIEAILEEEVKGPEERAQKGSKRHQEGRKPEAQATGNKNNKLENDVGRPGDRRLKLGRPILAPKPYRTLNSRLGELPAMLERDLTWIGPCLCYDLILLDRAALWDTSSTI
ncbi:hypothetical protein V8G54_029676 [Vigna mungo]|uniref:Uncharacterized protein n=1 Tax=Vigna mungo TaxID=3915 RepID=A0AAQ3RMV3_VIGMU